MLSLQDFSQSYGAETRHLGEAIRRAREHLERLQHDNGSYRADNLFGPVEAAQLIVFEKRYGVQTPEEETAEAVRFLRGEQLPDGSFPPYPRAPRGDLATTCHALAAFHAAGVKESDPARRRAAAYIEAAGGFRRARLDAKIFLHLAGLLDKRALPAGLLFHKLVPHVERGLIKLFGSWVVMLSNLVPGVLTALQHRPTELRSPFRKLALRRVEAYLWERQHPNGDWFGILGFTLLAVIFLVERGTPISDPRLEKAVAAMRRLKFRTPSGLAAGQLSTEIWDTAWAARALIESGSPPSDPRVRKAVAYLLSQQARENAPVDWQNTRAGAPGFGGFGWGEGDVYVPDTDDTGFVVLLLGIIGDQGAPTRAAADRAIQWLFGMQNASGGWPVHCHGQPTKRPGPLPFDSIYRRFWDTASEEITGRLLSALARHGYSKDHPVVLRAIDFLRKQVGDDGAWWGGWTINYLAATASVLSGLKDVGFDMSDPLVTRAVAWIKAHQNEDGGFGETVASYVSRHFAGSGPSRPSLTGFVLYGLLDAGQVNTPEVRAGIEYLYRTQNAQGTWEDDDVQNALSPYDDRYYFNAYMPKYFPLLALAKYRASSLNGSRSKG